jgi:hypothetical protein
VNYTYVLAFFESKRSIHFYAIYQGFASLIGGTAAILVDLNPPTIEALFDHHMRGLTSYVQLL